MICSKQKESWLEMKQWKNIFMNDFMKMFRNIRKYILRNIHQRWSFRKGALRKFAKFPRKHVWQSLFFNKMVVWDCNFIKKETLAQVISCEFCEISKNSLRKKPMMVYYRICRHEGLDCCEKKPLSQTLSYQICEIWQSIIYF